MKRSQLSRIISFIPGSILLMVAIGGGIVALTQLQNTQTTVSKASEGKNLSPGDDALSLEQDLKKFEDDLDKNILPSIEKHLGQK
ncbi:hypothetical protein HY411_01005 [Candidatus Gottesmanbacteria bacterium]|nr:hypothetical protein [Candidatus Gottesmanbacteria bacterium]